MAEAAKKDREQKSDAPASIAPAKPRADVLGILIVSLVVVNIASVGGMAYFMRRVWDRLKWLETNAENTAAPEPKKEVDTGLGKELQTPPMGVLFPIESFLVNIASDQGPKFLQAQMELELSEPGLEEEISRKKAAVRDAIIVLLSSRAYKELREPVGVKRLRKDIIQSVNNLLTTGKVKEVFFTQFHFN